MISISPRRVWACSVGVVFLGYTFVACSHPSVNASQSALQDAKLLYPGEVHFKNIRQLTRGGSNAEAYWSFDGRALSFQHKGPPITQDPAEPGTGVACDQIYTMKADGSGDFQFISKNRGRTTCAYYLPKNERVLFASTFATDMKCPPEPDKSKGYVWPIYNSYQLYSTALDGSDLRPLEPGAPRAYNAEATVCHDGSVVFTSDRDGDLDLYVGYLDSLGTLGEVKRVTHELGYDGGAFFSPDCKQLVWRASRPRPGQDKKEYLSLLKNHLVRPGALELWIGNADGSHARQVTRIGAASFAPFFTPDAKAIIFSSNPRDPRGRHFDIYKIQTNGTGLERLSFSNTFDSFPMFSPDGKKLAFSSNRNATQPHETNVFVADWVETAPVPLSIKDEDPANRLAALSVGLTPEKAMQEVLKSGFTLTPSEQKLSASWGKACGKKQPVLITADPANSLSLAAWAEVARKIQGSPTSVRSCFVASLESALPKAKVVLNIGPAGTMEGNRIRVSKEGFKVTPNMTKAFLQDCENRALHCEVTEAPPTHASGARLTFETVGSPSEANYTGAVQMVEVISELALRASAGR
ncbi:MAG TPA: hypothetical protein DCS07_17800 [Bdellovibrionales bacterium]|nr:MAG: hypothetical protein A2Z97_08370 [Bdellovibrionales bacterium GWB1_52_6]OFZ03016.1 MAG: hypothetical protein A2X97_12210 [Bdellovibrionales bacterium GWA1_52_35]OFZ36391.1 MAG: hypothetical protein A2070_13955 [Bdellovibrionales bacterium GWC1_52_8]HAR44456.1 hypothetical protein [Bdellovibrionales bacterium]HCM38824.1 hypothetical protein [Bdellovibrionales bacterium]